MAPQKYNNACRNVLPAMFKVARTVVCAAHSQSDVRATTKHTALQLAVDREYADRRVEFRLRTSLVIGCRAAFVRELFEACLLLARLRDIAGDKPTGLGGRAERFDIFAQAGLVRRDEG